MPRDVHDMSDSDSNSPNDSSGFARQRAIDQIERRRRFQRRAAMSGIGMMLLVVIWAFSEYNNARGWPTGGFSHSSSIPHVWNWWIIYPLIAWVLYLAVTGGSLYGRRPISENEIQREIDRQTGQP